MTVSISTRPAPQIFRFGPYQLDTGLRRLVRAGTDVPLAPKPTSFLILLLQQTGTLVPKQHLLREIWGGDVVSDSSVFQTAKLVRKALGTRDDGGEYIDRQACGGYRFVGPVDGIDFQEPAEDVADALGPYKAFVQARQRVPLPTSDIVRIRPPESLLRTQSKLPTATGDTLQCVQTRPRCGWQVATGHPPCVPCDDAADRARFAGYGRTASRPCAGSSHGRCQCCFEESAFALRATARQPSRGAPSRSSRSALLA